MKLTCPNCDSDDLDQGTTGKIICHGCQDFLMIVRIGYSNT